MYRYSKFIVALVVMVLALFFGMRHMFWGGAEHAMPRAMVSVLEVKKADMPVVFKFPGEAVGSKVVEIRPRVGGILEKVLFEEGQLVEEGAPLFQMEVEPYKVALQGAQAGLSKAVAQYNQVVREEARVRKIVAQGALPQKSLDDAISARELAKSEVELATTGVDQAKLNLGYTTIVAPVAGRASQSIADEGNLLSVGAGTVLARIIQADPLYVYFSLSEGEYIRMKQEIVSGALKLPEGGAMKVEMYYGSDIKFPTEGRVDFMEPEVGKGSGVVQMRAIFANPGAQVISGQFVRLVVNGGIRPATIVIPKKVVLDTAMGTSVFVVGEGDKVEIRAVKEGARQGNVVQIVEGLSGGERVIVDGFMKVKPGDVVKIEEPKQVEGDVGVEAERGAEGSEARQ